MMANIRPSLNLTAKFFPGEKRFRTRFQNHGPSHLTCSGLFLCDVIKRLEVATPPAQKVAVIIMNWIPAFKIFSLKIVASNWRLGRSRLKRALLAAKSRVSRMWNQGLLGRM